MIGAALRPAEPTGLWSLCICLVILAKISCIAYVQRFLRPSDIGYPPVSPSSGSGLSPVWDIGAKPHTVLMSSEETIHYQLEGDEAEMEWAALTPGDGMIYLGPDHRQFSPSVFHQLRCLDIFRHEIIRTHKQDGAPSQTALSRHCLNYLRQTALCRSDMTLLNLVGDPRTHPYPDTYECSDWEPLYKELKKNQESHRQWLESHSAS
ncbi:hypothetical protein BV25DRAFT_1847931 [Artomyces pyxidatus]|uniref:Uncharacterized protein n=1 Tax=Artomyces pyxidatus TaxID=48021 RepID=A0ACB8TG61_9AGAM|nr:hypothetical protein BV25DRAFT_1847931 [Artomyces pyxidatus]